MKSIRLLLAATPLVLAVACISGFPEDEWYDFVMLSCVHLNDQAAFNRCYDEGTKSRSVCYDAEGTRICRERPYLTCDRARLGAASLEQPHPPRDGLGCDKKPFAPAAMHNLDQRLSRDS